MLNLLLFYFTQKIEKDKKFERTKNTEKEKKKKNKSKSGQNKNAFLNDEIFMCNFPRIKSNNITLIYYYAIFGIILLVYYIYL